MRQNKMVEFTNTELIVLCSALMRQHTWTVETANANGYDWSDMVEQVVELRSRIGKEFEERERERGRIERELALIEKDYASDNWGGWEE
jgi:uncharacterized NAD(P)/FAD-binding protein YdhS